MILLVDCVKRQQCSNQIVVARLKSSRRSLECSSTRVISLTAQSKVSAASFMRNDRGFAWRHNTFPTHQTIRTFQQRCSSLVMYSARQPCLGSEWRKHAT